MKIHLVLVALLAFATFALCEKQNRILPLGASITYGCGGSCSGNLSKNFCNSCDGGYRAPLWTALKEQGINFTFVGSLLGGPVEMGEDRRNEGHSGWRIDQLGNIIVSTMHTFVPDTILIHVGDNDAYQNYTYEVMIARMGKLFEQILGVNPHATVYVSSLLPFHCKEKVPVQATLTKFNAALPALATEYHARGFNVTFVDVGNAGMIFPDDYADCGEHPNDSGYAKMAKVWAKMKY